MGGVLCILPIVILIRHLRKNLLVAIKFNENSDRRYGYFQHDIRKVKISDSNKFGG
jgi:hypothetical protein